MKKKSSKKPVVKEVVEVEPPVASSEEVAEVASNFFHAFLSKGFSSDQSFVLTQLCLKAYLWD